jgi:hypothetical protein
MIHLPHSAMLDVVQRTVGAYGPHFWRGAAPKECRGSREGIHRQMERIVTRGRREVVVRTLEEALAENLVVTHWKGIVEPGWVSTDDGYVVECTGVNEHTESQSKKKRTCRRRRVLNTSLGQCWVGPKARFLWEERKARMTTMPPVRWQVLEATRIRTKNVVNLYALMLLSGRVDYNVLRLMYRPNKIVSATKVKRILKQKEMIQMVSKEIHALMRVRGLTPEYVLEKMKKAVNVAEGKRDARNILRACDSFREMLGMDSAGGMLPAGIDPRHEANYTDILARTEEEIEDAKESNDNGGMLLGPSGDQ